jgi:hypothetical protein
MTVKMRPIDFNICRSCISSSTPNGWTEMDEEAAHGGFVYCPAEKRMVNHSFPDTCKFNLEYLLSEGKA